MSNGYNRNVRLCERFSAAGRDAALTNTTRIGTDSLITALSLCSDHAQQCLLRTTPCRSDLHVVRADGSHCWANVKVMAIYSLISDGLSEIFSE